MEYTWDIGQKYMYIIVRPRSKPLWHRTSSCAGKTANQLVWAVNPHLYSFLPKGRGRNTTRPPKERGQIRDHSGVKGDPTTHRQPSGTKPRKGQTRNIVHITRRVPVDGTKRADPRTIQLRHTRKHKGVERRVLQHTPLTIVPKRRKRTRVEDKLPKQFECWNPTPTCGTWWIPPQGAQPFMQPPAKARMDLRPERDLIEPRTSTYHHKTVRLPFTDLGSFDLDESLRNCHMQVRQSRRVFFRSVVFLEKRPIQPMLRPFNNHLLCLGINPCIENCQNTGLPHQALRILMRLHPAHDAGTPRPTCHRPTEEHPKVLMIRRETGHPMLLRQLQQTSGTAFETVFFKGVGGGAWLFYSFQNVGGAREAIIYIYIYCRSCRWARRRRCHGRLGGQNICIYKYLDIYIYIYIYTYIHIYIYV